MPAADLLLLPAIWLGSGVEATRWEELTGEFLVGASAGVGVDVTDGLWLEARAGVSSERTDRFPGVRYADFEKSDQTFYNVDPGKWADGRDGVRLLSGSIERPQSVPLELALTGFVGAGAVEQREWILPDYDVPGPTTALAATTLVGVSVRVRWPNRLAPEVHLDAYDRAWIWSSAHGMMLEVEHDPVVGVGVRLVLRRPQRR